MTGAQVLESSLTGISASSLATVRYVATTVSLPAPEPGDPAIGVSGTATCPAGQKVIGGGAQVSSDSVAVVNDASPTADRSAWTATAFAFQPGTSMVVTAICTSVVTAAG